MWMIQHQVSGIFLKQNPFRDLVTAIRAVAHGGKWLDQPFLKMAVSRLTDGNFVVENRPALFTQSNIDELDSLVVDENRYPLAQVLLKIARKRKLFVLEDAAQAHGAEYRARRAGSMADIACFSFYPGKNLGAYGDGGAITTDNAEFAERARMLRDHGRRDKYAHQIIGYGYRLDALQAAVLGVKLPHLDAWNARRRAIAACYTGLLAGTDCVTPYVPPHITPIYHIYCIRARDRDGLLKHLKGRGIDAGIHYPIPLHLQPVYKDLGYRLGDFPHAEKAASEILSLPMYAELTDAQVDQIVDAIKEFK